MKKQRNIIVDFLPGTTRTINRFAWIPKIIGSYWIWLQSYEELHVYRVEQIEVLVENKKKIIVKKYWDKVDERITE